MTTESFLLEAGWLFFTAWSVIVAAVIVVAFGRDFFPPKRSTPARRVQSQDPASPRA